MADFISQAQPFEIVILDGPFKAIGSILLEGRALPYRPISYEGEQRIKTTYYPGNPEATQQALGPIEKNTVITGGWHDRFLGNGVSQSLADTLDDLRRTASAIEVRWGLGLLPGGATVGKATVRRGLIKRFKKTLDRPQDVLWECEFEWSGRGDPVQPPLSAAGQQNPRAGFNEMAIVFQDSVDEVEAFTQDPFSRLAGLQQQIQNQVDDFVNTALLFADYFSFATDAIVETAQLTNDVIERVRGLCQHTSSSARALSETMLALPIWAIAVTDDALSLLDLQARLFDLLTSLDVTIDAASRMDLALAGASTPTILAELRVPAGTDLRDLALEFYGDPDLWGIIADFNGLVSSAVPMPPSGPSDDPGAPIRVPNRPPGQVSDVTRGC